MCGVFGFVADKKNNWGPDLKLITEIAKHNEATRGGHAWGVAWLDRHGRLRHHKEAGKIKATLLAELVEEAVALIGHTRWSTHGSEARNENNHPHPCDGGFLVHNGVLPEYYNLKGKTSRPLQSECDSELLAHAWTDATSDHFGERAQQMLDYCQPSYESPIVTLKLWHDELIAVRRGNPLTSLLNKDGVYLASILPADAARQGKVTDVADCHAVAFRQEKPGRWKIYHHKLNRGNVRPVTTTWESYRSGKGTCSTYRAATYGTAGKGKKKGSRLNRENDGVPSGDIEIIGGVTYVRVSEADGKVRYYPISRRFPTDSKGQTQIEFPKAQEQQTATTAIVTTAQANPAWSAGG